MKRMINNILLIICIFIFCISTWKLYGYYRSYKKAKDTYSKIAKENVKISKNERKIDFKKLKSQNQDIAGWIYIRGTTIDIRSFRERIMRNIYIRILIRRKAVQELFF